MLQLPATLLLLLKSGEARGERRLRISLVNPSLRREELGVWQFHFTEPPEGGANIRSPLRLKWDKEGLYWFEVFLEDIELTRIPLRLSIARTEQVADSATKKGRK